MTSAKSLSLIQLSLDLIYFSLSLFSYFATIFKYMDSYSIEILKLTYRFQDPASGLNAYVHSYYDQFNTYICADDKDLIASLPEVCDNLSNFKSSGIAFLSISILSHLTMLYGVLHLFARLSKSARPSLTFTYCHLIYPCIFSAAVGTYLAISGFFTLTPPDGFGDDYDVSMQIGLLSICGAEIFAIFSMIFYCVTKNRVIKEVHRINNNVGDVI